MRNKPKKKSGETDFSIFQLDYTLYKRTVYGLRSGH